MKNDQTQQPTVWQILRNLVFPLYLPGFIVAISRGMLIPILPIFASSLTDSYQLIGVIIAGEAIGTVIGDLPAGVVYSRWGMRRTMVAGAILLTIASTGIFFTTSISIIVLLRILSGIGLGLYNVTRHAYLAERVPIAQRGKAISLFGGLHRAGGFVGPAIGGYVGSVYALQAPFLIYGLLGLVAITILSVSLNHPDFDAPSAAVAHKQTHFSTILTTIRTHRRIILAAGMGQLLAQTVRVARQTIIPLFANDILGLSIDEIGYIVSAGSAIDTMFFVTGGIIMDRWGRKFAIVPSFILQGIGVAAVAFTSSFGSLLLVSMWLGFANSLSSGTMMTLGADLAPPDERGEFLGTWRLIGDSGFMTGPLIIGGIADLLALGPAALAMGGLGILAAAIFAQFVPETLQKTPPTSTE